MAIKFALNLCGYFAANDINFGMDSTGKIEWIASEGISKLMVNSTASLEEKKRILLKPQSQIMLISYNTQ